MYAGIKIKITIISVSNKYLKTLKEKIKADKDK